MNISSIQAIQLSQNAIGNSEKSDSPVATRTGFSLIQVPSQSNPPQGSTHGIVMNISYMEEQLKSLLDSFPPFFPVGSPQRINLIKKIKGLEEQIGKTSVDAQIKKVFVENPLPEQATDREISAALGKLFSFRDKLQEQRPVSGDPVKPGTLLNVKV